MRLLSAFLLILVSACAQEFTTYIGDGSSYRTAAMTTDAAGNTYLAGARYLNLPGLAGDPLPDVFVAGTTTSPDYPRSHALVYFPSATPTGGVIDGPVSSGEVASLYGPNIGPSTPVRATPDSSGNLPTSLAGVAVSVSGAAGINQDGTVNSNNNPAPRGSVVSVWATGLGLFLPIGTAQTGASDN